ncbi:hypothetical protein COY95_01895 [Candidatus Woesearchaeota archaeon CG_4_10_14_0_8_um_filter_47_5]|nr:MAG: hypothetical protein COY95_01895 [Candidatus Woesearchaeota archaeon CG_4_10_14_0_8_um_filter_47_5]
MADTVDLFPPVYIKFKGVVDIQDFYKKLHDWFVRRKFELHEQVYKAKQTDFGQEDENFWYAQRRENWYHMVYMNLYIWTRKQRDVEVIKDGKKKTLQKMEFYICIKTLWILDWQNLFQDSDFTRKIGKFFHNVIYDNEWFVLNWDKFYYYTIKLQEEIKEWLGMEARSHEAYIDMW